MKYYLVISVFILSFSTDGLCQTKYLATYDLKKNSFYLTAGAYPEGLYGNITGNFERIIAEFPKSFFQAFQVKIGGGPWVAWLAEGINFFSVASVLMGRSGSHLETGMGVLFTYRTDRKRWDPIVNDKHIAGNIGYRFQRPGGKLVLRGGLGWPEGYYLSLGICF